MWHTMIDLPTSYNITMAKSWQKHHLWTICLHIYLLMAEFPQPWQLLHGHLHGRRATVSSLAESAETSNSTRRSRRSWWGSEDGQTGPIFSRRKWIEWKIQIFFGGLDHLWIFVVDYPFKEWERKIHHQHSSTIEWRIHYCSLLVRSSIVDSPASHG